MLTSLVNVLLETILKAFFHPFRDNDPYLRVKHIREPHNESFLFFFQ